MKLCEPHSHGVLSQVHGATSNKKEVKIELVGFEPECWMDWPVCPICKTNAGYNIEVPESGSVLLRIERVPSTVCRD